MADWRNKLEMLSNKVKSQLFAKGVDSLEQLKGVFLQFDADQNGMLSQLEFEKFLSQLGVFLARQELRTIYDHFDHNKDGMVSYSEFVDVLKSSMSAHRLTCVKHAWEKVAGNGDSVSFEALAAKYNAPAHPRVSAREKKAETVFGDFIKLCGGKAVNGQLTSGAFVEYYSEINAVMPNEKENYFVDMIIKTWGLDADLTAVSEARLAQIQSVIFEKIRQKTHGTEDEGRTVKKIFKHFDKDGLGTIEPAEFTSALETLGCYFKDFELMAVFAKFDKNGNGRLDYEEFALAAAHRGGGDNPNVSPAFGTEREPPLAVLGKIRDTLKARGTHGIRGLGRVFRRMDNNGDMKFNRSEFMWGLRENGHKLTPSEFERVFKYFDRNNDQCIHYNEFLRGIRGPLNERRTGLVKLAFAKLDKSGNGTVGLEDLEGVYDVSFHPMFKSGAMTKEQILLEFMSQWDTLKKDNVVTVEEFIDYYGDVSSSIDDDDYFELMIRNAWHIAGGEGWCENTTNKRDLVIDADGTQHVEMVEK